MALSLPHPLLTVATLSFACVASSIPEGEFVTLWAAGLHAHTRGRKIWIEHYLRGGGRQPDVGCSPFYDFNRQDFVSVNSVLRNGDILKIHCQFDTTADAATVVGGESTDSEMCLAFISFYASIPASASQCYGPPTVEPSLPASSVPCFDGSTRTD
jgi:hypothetical protein